MGVLGSIGASTEGLVLRRYDTMIPIIPTPPPPQPDKFEAYMFSLLDRQKQIHREVYEEKPTKILLGTFEYKRFYRFFRDGPDRIIQEIRMLPNRFPLTAAMEEMSEKPHRADAEVVEQKLPTLLLRGLTVLQSEEEFHMEVL